MFEAWVREVDLERVLSAALGETKGLWDVTTLWLLYNKSNIIIDTIAKLSTYDHRSVRTGHPVRNHDVSIVFVVLGTKILENKVL